MIQDGHTILENYKLNCQLMSRIKAKNVDMVIISHTHSDHIALIPMLFARGNDHARIIVPEGSTTIIKEMLLDCAYINQRDCETINKTAEEKGYTPLYTENEVYQALSHIEEINIGNIVNLDEHVAIRYTPAGHILRSCQTELYINGSSHTRKLFFTGDLGNTMIASNKVFVENFQPITSCNIMFGECTYGERKRSMTKKDIKMDAEKIKTVIQQYCVDNNHRVLIPTFSLDRTPFILWEIYKIFGKDENFHIPIIIDSPLSNRLLDCYSSILNAEEKKQFDEMMSWKNIHRIISPEDSKAAITDKGAKVIIASSGMLTAGRSVKWVQSILPCEHDAIMFIGYAANNTLAYKIKHGESQKTININGKPLKNKCQIIDLHSFSSHMQRDDLLKYYSAINCEKIYLVHSDKKARSDFKEDLENEINKKLKSTRVVCINKGIKISL